jgi:peptidyl-prolyl cis-trans isomerase C
MIEGSMQPEKRQKQTGSTLSFHLMKFAVQDFQKNTSQLTTEEYDQASQLANEEMLLHQVILNSEEACCVVIPEQNIQQTLRRIIAEYQDKAHFHATLRENNLQFTDYLTALHNDLRVETVLARIASSVQSVTSLEILDYYKKNKTDFTHPEQRSGAHIQIFSNPSVSSGIDPALQKMIEIHHRVCLAPNTFSEEALLYSECDTRKDGGRLGMLVAGELCDELDRVLFSLKTGAISPVIKSFNGFHILQCREILPGKNMCLAEAAPAISSTLLKKKQLKACRSWLERLMQTDAE